MYSINNTTTVEKVALLHYMVILVSVYLTMISIAKIK